MSLAEEKFMKARSVMEHRIADFYESCQEIEIDNEGFAEDVKQAVKEATNGKVIFEDWVE